MASWTIVDAEDDREVGTVRYEGYLDYLGDDFDVEEIVLGLSSSDEDSFAADLERASGGRYVAVPDEGVDEAEASPGDQDADEDEDLSEAEAEPAWEAIFTEGERPLGRLLGCGGSAELDVQDPALHGSLLVDVLPAIEALGLAPHRPEYREALVREVERLAGRSIRVEVRETRSLGGNQGGDLPNAVVRYGASSPDWGGPAAPWSPVPLEPARKYIKQNPDAAIEVNFPTVFEEDRSAKIRDLLQGDVAGFVSHRRSAEAYAKEMGFEQYNYDEEQAEISSEKPRASTVQGLAQEMAPGAPGAGGGMKIPGMQGTPGQSKPPGVDGPVHPPVRAKAVDDHAFKLDQGAMSETERRAEIREKRAHRARVEEAQRRGYREQADRDAQAAADRRVADNERRVRAEVEEVTRRSAEGQREAYRLAQEADRRALEAERVADRRVKKVKRQAREALRKVEAEKVRLLEAATERERQDRRLLESERVSADRLAAQRPEIRVEAPRVEVHPPAITVEAPRVDVRSPDVKVDVHLPRPADKRIEYDSEGRATGLTSVEG